MDLDYSTTVEEEKKRKNEEGGARGGSVYRLGRATTYGATESRQNMWRDPGYHVSVQSSSRSYACQRGIAVAPEHVARLLLLSRHEAWRGQKCYFMEY